LRRRGFTLIELLVVIGIIVILISILVPILSGARDAGVRLRCMNNMKQLANANLLYENDYNGYLPWPNWDAATTGWLYRYQSGFVWTQSSVRTGLLWRYHQSDQTYRCPLDTGPWTGSSSNLTSYLMNGATCGYGAGTPGVVTISATGLPIPPRGSSGLPARWFKSDAICFWEPQEERPGATSAVWNDGSSYPTEALTVRHGAGDGDGACVGMFSGAAEWITRIEFKRLSAGN
jgi:prepilin-type N-terminal cleavage/methylation domain-containing protein